MANSADAIRSAWPDAVHRRRLSQAMTGAVHMRTTDRSWERPRRAFAHSCFANVLHLETLRRLLATPSVESGRLGLVKAAMPADVFLDAFHETGTANDLSGMQS